MGVITPKLILDRRGDVETVCPNTSGLKAAAHRAPKSHRWSRTEGLGGCRRRQTSMGPIRPRQRLRKFVKKLTRLPLIETESEHSRSRPIAAILIRNGGVSP